MNDEKKLNKKQLILGFIGIIIIIALIICFVIAYNNTKISNSENTKNNSVENAKISNSTEENSTTIKETNDKNISITVGGSYDLSGSYESITINTKQDVELKLNGSEITCTKGPAINIENAGIVTINLSGKNKITATTTEDLDGAIYSKADLVFTGDGSLEVKSNYDGIVSKDTLVIKNGTYTINSDDDGIRGKDSVEIQAGTFTINAAGDGIKATNDEDTSLGDVNIASGSYNITAKSDGIQAITKATINGGTFNITASEGIEATYVIINDGTVNIEATDDGINASQKSNIGTPKVEINNGNITIKMGQGDTDAIDSNGNIYINGGTINITANSPFDYDGTAENKGGTIIVNGTQTNTITNQMMGGGQMNGGPQGNMQNDRMQNSEGQQMNQNGGMPSGGGPQGRR